MGALVWDSFKQVEYFTGRNRVLTCSNPAFVIKLCVLSKRVAAVEKEELE